MSHSMEQLLIHGHLQLSKVQNDVLVKRKREAEKTSFETELVASQIELKACEEQLRALESAVECASDPSRLRLLPGANLTPGEIRERIERLEVASQCTIDVPALILH